MESGWAPRPSMGARRHVPGVGVLDGLIYVAGGADDQWNANVLTQLLNSIHIETQIETHIEAHIEAYIETHIETQIKTHMKRFNDYSFISFFHLRLQPLPWRAR